MKSVSFAKKDTMKKFTKFFGFMVGLLFIGAGSGIEASPVIDIQDNQAETNTEKERRVHFDIDGVCLERDNWETAKIIGSNFPWVLTSFTPSNIASARKHVKENGWAAEGWIEWSKERKLSALYAMIIGIQDSKKVIPGTIAIIKALKQKGYKVYAATNMGANEFARHCQDKLKDLFDGAVTVDYSRRPVVKKPQKEYYERVVAGHNPTDSTLFVDDSKKNIAAATSFFDYVVHFTKPEKFATYLKSIGWL
jgi:HAD superfamily hydrolase (TIGR01509 family)